MTRINTNVPSLVAQNRLQSSNSDLQTALTRLSTGLRINSGADDPAGLIASEALRSEITSLGKAISNTRRASQIISTADSALGEVSNLLNDIRGLVVEAANSGALSDSEIAANQLQVDSSLEAVNRIAQTTTFQGRKLLDGSLAFLTEAGTNFNTVTDLQIDQANLGSTGSVSVDVAITAAAEQAQVAISNIPIAFEGVSSEGSVDFTRVVAPAKATGVINFSEPAAEVQSSTAAIALANTGASFTLASVLGGTHAGDTLNDYDVNVTTVAFGTGTDSSLTIDDFNGEINIVLEATVGLDTIAGQLSDTNITFTESNTNAVAVEAPITAVDAFANGAAAGATNDTAFITLEAVADGVAANDARITFTQADGTVPPTAVVDANGDITIEVEDTDNVTFADIKTAIENEGTYTATIDTSGGLTDFDGDDATATTTAFSGGIDAATLTASINLSSLTDSDAANGATITFSEVNGTLPPTAAVDGSGNITITVDDATAVDLDDIVAAINNEGTYEAEKDEAGGITEFNSATDTSATTAFVNGVTPLGGLASNVVFELQGSTGSEVFNVSAGTSIDDLVSQINLVSDATSVTAFASGSTLQLTSSKFGSDSVVDLRVIEEDATGTFTTEISAGVRDEGSDIVAKVNGVDASGDGNILKINTATLDLSITVDEGSDENFGFTINGGGALFQLGADVVGNQQARIGINSVNTARLGGPEGKLFQLTSGQSAALATDPNAAARIVTAAITQVTSLRGRLGAFQATTLESNLVSLSETQANLLEAESSIRDADFAQESANLTRAQILVQSGTNVLSLANQNPQNVLSLLR